MPRSTHKSTPAKVAQNYCLSKDSGAWTQRNVVLIRRSSRSGQFIVRSDDEVKRSRVSAYRYLVP